jgi:hypothetical protein
MGEQDGGNANDPIKNVKAEFERKLGNVDQQMAAIKQSTDTLLNFVRSQQAAKPAAPAVKLEDVWLDNHEAAAAIVVDRATQAIEQKLNQREANNTRTATTIQKLVSEFPELSSSDHELTMKANEVYNSMSEDEKTSPVAYKAAVNAAALDLGYMPKAKRTEEYEEAFALRGGNSATRNTRRGREPSLAQETLDFAALVGLDTDSKEVKESLKARSTRDYGKWQSPKTNKK